MLVRLEASDLVNFGQMEIFLLICRRNGKATFGMGGCDEAPGLFYGGGDSCDR